MRLSVIVMLVVIGILALVTNPSAADFDTYLGSTIGELKVERSNYALFSVYTVKIPDHNDAVFLGIFGQIVEFATGTQ